MRGGTSAGQSMFASIEPTLPHVRVNAEEDVFQERPNPCPTPESLYDLCDLKKAYELFKNDFVLEDHGSAPECDC